MIYNVIERESVVYALSLCCFICKFDNIYGVPANSQVSQIQKARAEHYDAIVDNDSEQKEFIVGWFNRLNDIGRKYGTGIKLRSRHLK